MHYNNKNIKNTEGEVWLPIEGYPYYEVSNFGRVKSLSRLVDMGQYIRQTNDIIKSQRFLNDYLIVDLCVYGMPKRVQKTLYVHRLAAIAFLENPENKPEVNHKDGDKSNNKISNLEWNTISENQQHAMDTGLKPKSRGENSNLSKLKEVDILKIRSLYMSGNILQKEIAETFNISKGLACMIINRKVWKYV